MCLRAASTAFPVEIFQRLLIKRLEKLWRYKGFSFVEPKHAPPRPRIRQAADLGDRVVVAAQQNSFTLLYLPQILGKMRLCLMHIDSDHKLSLQ